MIKNLTISAVFLTMFLLTSNAAKADYLGLSNNSHIASNMDFLRDAMTNDTDTTDIVPEPAPVLKAKVAKTKPGRNLTVVVSAYTSTPNQTDATPFNTANGEYVYWGGVAANIIDANGRNIPFGTKIMMPGLFGDQIFTVNDRMNRRYQKNVDIWFTDIADAREFGRKTVSIVILAQN